MSREITEEQAIAASKLKAAFKREKAINKTNYDEVSHKIGINGSTVSHYLNARIAINMPFLLKFCSVFPRINPIDIYPELFEGIEFPTPNDPRNILKKFYALDDTWQEVIGSIIDNHLSQSDVMNSS